MKSIRTRISLLLFPTLIILGFEYLRHAFCIPYVSLQTGDWMMAGMTAISIALISQSLFSHFEQAERSLSLEREKRAIMVERERLARELHDQIAQSIFYMGVEIDSLRQANAKKPIDSGAWDELLLALREMDKNVRQAIFNLRQDTEATLNFRERVQRFLENAFSNSEIHWTVNFCETVSLETKEQIHLFGILQEAVTNICKHASATSVYVTLAETSFGNPTKWEFEIRDDGVGFNSRQRQVNQYGLDIIKNRAKDINATSFIESNGRGTSIRIVKNMRKVGIMV